MAKDPSAVDEVSPVTDTVTELENLKAAFDASEMDFWECKASDSSNKDAIIFDGCSMWNPKSYLVCQGCHKKLRAEAASLPVQWRWSATDASLLNTNESGSKTSNYDNIESLYHQWILYDIESMISLERAYQEGVSNFDLTILVISDDYGMNNQRLHYKIDLNRWTQSRKSGGGRPRTIQRIDCNDYICHNHVLKSQGKNDKNDKNEKNEKNNNNDYLCPICQCGFEPDSNDKDDDMVTLCDKGHYMHRSCAKLLINSNNGVRCPECRQPMKLPKNVAIQEKKRQFEQRKKQGTKVAEIADKTDKTDKSDNEDVEDVGDAEDAGDKNAQDGAEEKSDDVVAATGATGASANSANNKDVQQSDDKKGKAPTGSKAKGGKKWKNAGKGGRGRKSKGWNRNGRNGNNSNNNNNSSNSNNNNNNSNSSSSSSSSNNSGKGGKRSKGSKRKWNLAFGNKSSRNESNNGNQNRDDNEDIDM